MVISGVLGLPVFFPFGVPSLLIAGAIGASAVSWQELGAMRDRLKPEYLRTYAGTLYVVALGLPYQISKKNN